MIETDIAGHCPAPEAEPAPEFARRSYRLRFDELHHAIGPNWFHNMGERLLFYLRCRRDMFDTNVISISFTEMAQGLNSSREVISRRMNKLSGKGVIQLHRSFVEIVDLERALA